MAAPKNPADMSEWMKLLQPEAMAKMFDTKAMMENFGMKMGDMDPTEAMNNAKEQFDAMVKANEAAAASYRDLMAKQTQIFQDLTSEAAEQMQNAGSADAGEVYQTAVKRSFEIMAELSEAANQANTQAFEAVRGQVEQAMKDLKPKG
ncbi:MAG: hypothetical protein AB8B71_10955 [Paracoccaceae bacterium]